ncbi:hypothetical protein T4B_3418, partial [Trichinella pseudospiralis]
MYLMKEFCRHNIIPLNATSIVKKQLQTAKIEEEQHQEVMIQQCPYRNKGLNLVLATSFTVFREYKKEPRFAYHKTVYDNL